MKSISLLNIMKQQQQQQQHYPSPPSLLSSSNTPQQGTIGYQQYQQQYQQQYHHHYTDGRGLPPLCDLELPPPMIMSSSSLSFQPVSQCCRNKNCCCCSTSPQQQHYNYHQNHNTTTPTPSPPSVPPPPVLTRTISNGSAHTSSPSLYPVSPPNHTSSMYNHSPLLHAHHHNQGPIQNENQYHHSHQSNDSPLSTPTVQPLPIPLIESTPFLHHRLDSFASNPLLGLVTVATSTLAQQSQHETSHTTTCCSCHHHHHHHTQHQQQQQQLPFHGESTSIHSLPLSRSNSSQGQEATRLTPLPAADDDMERITLSPIRNPMLLEQARKGTSTPPLAPLSIPKLRSSSSLASPPLVPTHSHSSHSNQHDNPTHLVVVTSPTESHVEEPSEISSLSPQVSPTLDTITITPETSSRTRARKTSSSASSSSSTKERSFICPQCQMTFARKQNLKSHLTIHTNERPHACSSCPSKFRRRQELLRHERSVHAQLSPSFSCPFCSQTFHRADSFKKHLFLSSQMKLSDCQPTSS